MRLRGTFYNNSLILILYLILAFGGLPGADDDDGENSDGYDIHWEDRNEVRKWWSKFREKSNYPLYCIVLASTSDTEIARFIENFRSELATISDKDCCFIFFRELSRRKYFTPFEYSEHARMIYPLAKYFSLDLNLIPCFIFFEQFDSGEHICISLKLLTDQEIIRLVRKIFNHLQNDRRRNPLDKLKHFQHERILQASSQTLLQNLRGLGKETLLELLKSLVTLHK